MDIQKNKAAMASFLASVLLAAAPASAQVVVDRKSPSLTTPITNPSLLALVLQACRFYNGNFSIGMIPSSISCTKGLSQHITVKKRGIQRMR